MNTPQNSKSHKHIINKGGLLFDQISRQIILDFYSKSKEKSKFWIWWNRNAIVTRYETIKVQHIFDKSVKKWIEKSLVFRLIAKIDRYLYYHFY